MRKRNIYKDIVFFVLGCFFIGQLVNIINFWMQQQNSYDLILQSESELSEAVIKEMEKINGLYQFTPACSCNLNFKLEEYTMEGNLTGIELESYSLKWKSLQEKITLGNTPILFFGKDIFASFVDNNGNAPGRSQIAEWLERYQELELTITDEEGQIWKGKISGILKKPAGVIYMGREQMQEIFNRSAKTTGGLAKIQGHQNMKQAQELLSAAGFAAELIE